MSFQAIAAQLEFLAWRDAQLAAISLQLEEALPALLDELTEQVERASIVNLVRSTIALKSSAEAIIQRWGADQLVKALGRAEAELDQTFLKLPGKVNLDSDVWEQVALLHKSSDDRGCPFPGRTHPTASVTGMPSAVKPFRTATRTWNSAT